MTNFIVSIILFMIIFGNIFMKDINIVLTFPSVNFTKLNLIMAQNLQLSKCPANSYSVNFVKFNETPVFQSPLGVNNFQNIDMVFGPDRYFGPLFFGFTPSTTNFKFQTAFISNYNFNYDVRFLTILAIVNNTIISDTSKVILFILNSTRINLMQPWKSLNPHAYLSSFKGTLTTLYYSNVLDGVRIANEIKTRGVTNIIMDLNYNGSLTVLTACNDRNLLNWRIRWMVFFSLLPYKFYTTSFTIKLSNNFTMYDFGQLSQITSPLIDEERDVYLYDICYTIVNLMDYQNCNQPMPSVLNLGTGTVTFNGQTIQRSSWILNAFQIDNTINQIGNVLVDMNNNVNIALPVIPIVLNRTTDQILLEMRSYPLRIAAMVEKPFVYYDSNGNLTGYSVETINLILKNLSLQGQIVPYYLQTGKLQNGIFSGILGVLQNGQADIAIGPITYFSQYTNYINFTTKFKSYNVAIMYHVNLTQQYLVMFDFITAYTPEAWVLIIVSCFVYACALTLINLVSPNEAKMTLYDTFFFTMGSVVQGVTTALPDKVSGRILVIFWWLLNISVLLTYVANNASYLTYLRLQATIQDNSDLLSQTDYSFGTVINSSIDEYLASSQTQINQQVNSAMRSVYLQLMQNSTNSSVNLVANQNYAFIYQDAVLNQYKSNSCTTVTNGFDQLYYAYALMDSDYTTVISSQLDYLISQKVLAQLDAKYFPTINSSSCTQTDIIGYIVANLSIPFIPNPPNSLTIKQTAGIFVIMLGGIIISLIVALVEFIVRKCRKKSNNEESDA